jgi:hypothetical protein
MPTPTQSTAAPSDSRSLGDKSSSPAAAGFQQRWQQLGSEARRTWLFVGGALACLAVTALFELASRPDEIREYGKVGQEFYPEFTDPTLATSLAVKVIDSEELEPLEFSVLQADNGRWVIPSHHNYPADAADQLAKTASSVIGIKRGAMVTRWASDHPRYGVVDPETDSVSVDQIEGIGKRLTLANKDGVLASYIIGEKLEGKDNQYYVRHPGEDETYIADLDISLSTRFRDWINTDLLDITNFDVRRLSLNDYSFEERGTTLALTNTVVSTLTRESSGADWTMEGIDTQSQEVNQEAARSTVDAVADLAIIGVRPKQPGLTADLKLDRDALRTQRDLDRLQSDLLSRGFLLQPSQSDPNVLRLISREGEMSAGTEDGLVYNLHFGRVFTGSEKELEIGLNADSGDQKPADKDQSEGQGDGAATAAKADSQSADPDSNNAKTAGETPPAEQADSPQDKGEPAGDEASGKPGRYVFVRVEFDPTLLGDKPNPVEPQMPEELRAAEATDEKAAEATDEKAAEATDEKAEEKEGEPAQTAEPSAETPAANTDPQAAEGGAAETKAEAEKAKEEQLQKLRQQYEETQQKFQDDKRALEDYEAKVTAGTKKAEDLNRRFAQWYYVIPGESYDKLSLSRDDLLKAKEAAAPGAEATEGDAALQPPAAAETVGDSSPADPGAAEMKQPGEAQPKEETPPADATAPEPPQPAEGKPAEGEPVANEAPAESPQPEAAKPDQPAAEGDAEAEASAGPADPS